MKRSVGGREKRWWEEREREERDREERRKREEEKGWDEYIQVTKPASTASSVETIRVRVIVVGLNFEKNQIHGAKSEAIP